MVEDKDPINGRVGVSKDRLSLGGNLPLNSTSVRSLGSVSACVALDFECEKMQSHKGDICFGIALGVEASWWDPGDPSCEFSSDLILMTRGSSINMVYLYLSLLLWKRCKVTKENLFEGKIQIPFKRCMLIPDGRYQVPGTRWQI